MKKSLELKKRADGRYQRSVTISGKVRVFYGKNSSEINKKIVAFKEKEKQGRLFKEIAKEWYENILGSISPTTWRGYNFSYECAIEEFGDMPAKDITTIDINNYIIRESKKKYSHKTCFTRLQIVRQILDFAILQGDITFNPAAIIKVPKGLAKSERSVPCPEDIIKIKNSIGNTFYIFAFIALYTGCRRGEILALTWEDINFEENEISINKSVYYNPSKPYIKEPKSKKGIRTIPLLEPLKDVIEPFKSKGYIFTNDSGELYTSHQGETLWKHYCKETGIDITPHQLRHAYATRLFELNIAAKVAQSLLGHADIQTTQNIYTHISDLKRKATAKELEKF